MPSHTRAQKAQKRRNLKVGKKRMKKRTGKRAGNTKAKGIFGR